MSSPGDPVLKTIARFLVLVVLSGCATADPPVAPTQMGATGKRLFVLNHGWHSGIVIRKADIAPGLLSEAEDFPEAESLEIGWGDWDYYQSPDPGVGLAIRAAFFSGASVIHVVGFSGAVQDYFSGAEIFELNLSEEGFRRLAEFISGTFARDESKLEDRPRKGSYPNSRFYPARGKFHLFRNCNTWVAEALETAGLPLNARSVLTAGSLASRVARLGKRIAPAS